MEGQRNVSGVMQEHGRAKACPMSVIWAITIMAPNGPPLSPSFYPLTEMKGLTSLLYDTWDRMALGRASGDVDGKLRLCLQPPLDVRHCLGCAKLGRIPWDGALLTMYQLP